MTGADIDADGDIDLITSNRSGNSMTVLMNSGAGTFSVAGTVATGIEPRYVVAGDFNGDCALDLAVAAHDSRTVQVFTNSGAGTFGGATSYPVPFNEKASGLAAADLDGDGDLDLAAGIDVNDAGAIAVFTNAGGSFIGQVFMTGGINPGAVDATCSKA